MTEGRRLAGYHALTVAAMLAGFPSGLAEAAPVRTGPEPAPTPSRPTLGAGCAYPSRPAPPREPTKAELLAADKRKRKAARRLELARKAGT